MIGEGGQSDTCDDRGNGVKQTHATIGFKGVRQTHANIGGGGQADTCKHRESGVKQTHAKIGRGALTRHMRTSG